MIYKKFSYEHMGNGFAEPILRVENSYFQGKIILIICICSKIWLVLNS